MSSIITTKSPVFWVIVCAGVVLPALSLEGPARIAVTLFVVAFVVIGFVRARRQGRGVAARN
ncbi:hypothetical protein LWF15_27665 [Kineosporia rhizophila]|uniref:hypothetical protein n=1 Tax=Kineosporia TaxID=49184 RepID=UPI001E52021A|nr:MULTISPECIES: hypothetical protein [Kineosporia]MCE0539282.1 hypothetical protein [Kineosporia rhizophila]GLY14431.1 hypothetical protein Kisp01_14460 [Kineosporia sp. NBRC 101677]